MDETAFDWNQIYHRPNSVDEIIETFVRGGEAVGLVAAPDTRQKNSMEDVSL